MTYAWGLYTKYLQGNLDGVGLLVRLYFTGLALALNMQFPLQLVLRTTENRKASEVRFHFSVPLFELAF